MPAITAAVVGHDFILNGKFIRGDVLPADLHSLLGPPARIVDAGAPHPTGHRGNQIHVYDDSGLIFHEHHFRYLVNNVSFVLWPEEWAFPFTPKCGFSGELTIAGLGIRANQAERGLRESNIGFKFEFGGTWRLELPTLTILVDTMGSKLRSGRRSKARKIAAVHISWPNDPWDTRYRPSA